jgi:hypothetical protein
MHYKFHHLFFCPIAPVPVGKLVFIFHQLPCLAGLAIQHFLKEYPEAIHMDDKLQAPQMNWIA